MANSKIINTAFSGYLDLMRFGAAFVVLLHHFAHVRFSDKYYWIIRELNLGSDAVVLFFVLSGFVITFAATEKDKMPKRFIFSRLTRLWSVAIPALILTAVLDAWGLHKNPEFYLNTPFYEAVQTWKYWFRGLSFSTYWFGDHVRLGSNGPFWSLSYEAAYYIAFGIILYLRGPVRWMSLTICAALFGLKILILAPAWFMGVGAYILLKKAQAERFSTLKTHLMIWTPVLLYIMFHFIYMPELLRMLTKYLIGADGLLGLGFSDEFAWNAIIGGLFATHLFGVSLYLSKRTNALKGQAWIKWLAGGSFSLYLVHYPVVQWGAAVFPRSDILFLNHVLLLGFTLIVCYVFAALFERPLPRYRRAILDFVSKKLAVKV